MTAAKWWLAALVVALLAFGVFIHDKTVAERALYEARDKARADSITGLRKEMAALTAKRDTLILTRTKQVNHFDTLATTLLTHDTVTFHDTLYVKATTAEAAVNACRPIITTDDRLSSTCEERVKNAVAQARLEDSRRVDATKQEAGYLRRHVGFVVGYGATLTGGELKVGPSATLGLRIWP